MVVAVITGASRGLGHALAAGLADTGWALVIDARNAGELATATQRLRARGASIVAVPGDVTDPGHRRELVAAAERLGGPDLLVNNAASWGPARNRRCPATRWTRCGRCTR